MKKIFGTFLAQFCFINGKNFKDVMKIFIDVAMKNREVIGISFFQKGEKLELLAKIFALVDFSTNVVQLPLSISNSQGTREFVRDRESTR